MARFTLPPMFGQSIGANQTNTAFTKFAWNTIANIHHMMLPRAWRIRGVGFALSSASGAGQITVVQQLTDVDQTSYNAVFPMTGVGVYYLDLPTPMTVNASTRWSCAWITNGTWLTRDVYLTVEADYA